MGALLFMLAAIDTLAAVEVTTRDLPRAIVGQPYQTDALAAASGGRCPASDVEWQVVGGGLPPGIELSGGGYLTGVPAEEGEYGFRVAVVDACGAGTRELRLIVTGAPILAVGEREVRLEGDGAATLLVGATWPGLPYLIDVANGPWLSVEPALGRTPRAGAALRADPVRLRAKAGGLAPGRYTATLRVSAWQAREPVDVRVVLTVSH